ncbi:proteasome maturation factor UMP1 [Dunaliella salina]|uniref:Proteasome maturation factor UMP1 n=1 Tax=Dunaliella salina TaxID=3046 RepID=A0ABQ7H2G5_DUNSA|nr:proteasome maturation factor UMP1 [Dunaliella salina]|eukprot:KAF5841054.1 proteasome maturation factor UMP1 [Dunaliella salina]
MANSLPYQVVSHDTLRQGLPSLKGDAMLKHPVELIQQESKKQASVSQTQMLTNLYGSAVPAKMSIESQILGSFQRLPGLHSSKLGLESLTGTLDEFGFESYLGLPENCPDAPPDLHSQMEQRLHLGGKPVARGL